MISSTGNSRIKNIVSLKKKRKGQKRAELFPGRGSENVFRGSGGQAAGSLSDRRF